MKFKHVLFTVLCGILGSGLWAQGGMNVQGTITDANNNPLSGVVVNILITDSLGGPTLATGQVTTDPNGIYYDTLFWSVPTTSAAYLEVWVTDCQGTVHTDSSVVPLPTVVAFRDFTLPNCGPACDASFTMSYDSITGNVTCTPTTSGLTYQWLNSAGVSSTNQIFTFNVSGSPGTYWVWLYVADSSGTCADTAVDTIVVNQPYPCSAGFNVSILGNNVVATATIPGLVYNWTTSTGAMGSLQTFNWSNVPPGTHTITLVAGDSSGNCGDTVSQVITIQPQCNSGFSAWSLNDSTYYYQAWDSLLTNYTWTIDGVTVGNSPILMYNFGAVNQSYQVCLIVGDTNTGCSDTTCSTTVVTITPPVPCDASFLVADSVWGNPASQEFYFVPNHNNIPGRIYTWFFGDGNFQQSNWQGATTYSYDSAGTYTVCLAISDSTCTDTICQTITVLHPGYGSIYGNILADSNYADSILVYADSAVVYLIEYSNTGGGTLTAIDSISTSTGWYQFTGVPAGTYLIKAALDPGSSVYNSFVPAYYVTNSFPGVLNWASGTSVSVGNGPGWNTWGRDVHLIYGNNPGGPGFIGGLVSQGANKTSGPGDPVENVLVMLLDQNGDPVNYTYSNANGEFTFDNLALGTYTVYTDIAGLTTDPATLTLTNSYQREELVQVEVNSSYIETYIGMVNSVTDETSDRAIRLFPVPAGDHLNLEFGSDWSQEAVSIRMYDMTGKELRNWKEQANGVVTLNLQGIDAGVYVIQVDNGTNVEVYSIIK